MEKRFERKLYMGIVEDNYDSTRKGRIKVRVQSIYNQIPVEDIPYASPFMDLAGKEFKIPAIGKIVNVLFLTNDIYDPYYIYSQNYNINLENKLYDLSDDEYVDFVALLFDERTQISATSKEFTIDHLYNKISITNDTIDINLKDNMQLLNLGDDGADQDAVLGNHWFDWMDKFVKTLLQPTALLGNQSAPIIRPQIDALLQEYQAIRPTFVSNNVKIVDNNEVNKNKRIPQTDTTKEDKSLIDNTFDFENIQNEIETQASKACDIEKKSKPTTNLPTPQTEYNDSTDPNLDEKRERKKIDGKIYIVTDENRMELDALERKADQKNNNTITTDISGGMYRGQQYQNKNSDINSDSNGTTNSQNKKYDRNKIENIKIDIPASNDIYPVYVDGKFIKDAPGIKYKGQIVIADYYSAIKKMIDAASLDGINMSLTDAYRSYDNQYQCRVKFGGTKGKINENWLKTTNSRGNPPQGQRGTSKSWYFWKTWESNPSKMQVAPPGYGYHISGRAFDISTRRSDVYEWLQKNAIEFGFARTVKSETWHWEYKPWEIRKHFEAWNMYSFIPENHSSWTKIDNITKSKDRKKESRTKSQPREC